MNKELKLKARALQAILQIGKNGVTESFKAELKKTVTVKKLVKIKLLRSFADAHEAKVIAQSLAEELNLVVIEVKGNTITFSENKA